MRKQTNLAEVKLTALALLSTEINETPYSPMIVKHPFTDTGVSAIPDGKGGVEMIDLTEDDVQFKWRQSIYFLQHVTAADKNIFEIRLSGAVHGGSHVNPGTAIGGAGESELDALG